LRLGFGGTIDLLLASITSRMIEAMRMLVSTGRDFFADTGNFFMPHKLPCQPRRALIFFQSSPLPIFFALKGPLQGAKPVLLGSGRRITIEP
jgi:hypothetical protein